MNESKKSIIDDLRKNGNVWDKPEEFPVKSSRTLFDENASNANTADAALLKDLESACSQDKLKRKKYAKIAVCAGAAAASFALYYMKRRKK